VVTLPFVFSSMFFPSLLSLSVLLSSTLSIVEASPIVFTASPNRYKITPTSATTIAPASEVDEIFEVDDISNVGGVKKQSNPVSQLLGYLRDSALNFKDAVFLLRSNGVRCGDIRSKQKEFIRIAKLEMSEDEQKRTKGYSVTAGGITFDEFAFLQKGVQDRIKVVTLSMYLVFASKILPYAIMFNPEMLPSPFQKTVSKAYAHSDGKYSDPVSRFQSHEVLKVMIALEKGALVPPTLSKLNPFGQGRTMRMMEGINKMGATCADLLTLDGSGAEAGIVQSFRRQIYTRDKPDKGGIYLKAVNDAIMKGVGNALNVAASAVSMGSSNVRAPGASNPLIPGYILRRNFFSKMKDVTAADVFLVDQGIDLQTLEGDLLRETCLKRLIGVSGRSDSELRKSLSSWLDLTVVQPKTVTEKTGLHYNGNMARLIMMCYNAVDSAKDDRSSSYLPRIMFRG